MTRLRIELPDSVAKRAEPLATKDEISLDQFVALAWQRIRSSANAKPARIIRL